MVLLLVLLLLAAAWAAHVTWAQARALRERKPRRKGGASGARLAKECVRLRPIASDCDGLPLIAAEGLGLPLIAVECV